MSVVNEDGEKVELPKDAGHIYSEIERSWAGKDPERWQGLLMLQAHEFLGWTEERLGITFGLAQGNVSRRLSAIRNALAKLTGLQELADGRQTA